MTRPLTPLRGPELKPARYGLVNPSTLVSEPARWEPGFAVESQSCNVAVSLLNMCAGGASGLRLINPAGSGDDETWPFAVQATFECSTFGWKAQDYEARARTALEAVQSKAVEHEFWTGEIAQSSTPNAPNRYLTDGNAVDLTPTPGTAIKVKWGLALLEEALGDCGLGTCGYIHATRAVTSAMNIKDWDDDDVMTTKLGNYVIPGTGYAGTGPNGETPTGSSVWMFATGPVTVRLGDIEIVSSKLPETVDKNVNNISVSAERFAAANWDGCCQFAVLVDLSLDYA